LHRKVLAIALANKLGRIAWAVLNKEQNFECVIERYAQVAIATFRYFAEDCAVSGRDLFNRRRPKGPFDRAERCL
jgi:hypothetical protein